MPNKSMDQHRCWMSRMRTSTELTFFSGALIPKNSPIASFSLDSYTHIAYYSDISIKQNENKSKATKHQNLKHNWRTWILKHTGWYCRRLLMMVSRIVSNMSGSSTLRPLDRDRWYKQINNIRTWPNHHNCLSMIIIGAISKEYLKF